MTSVTISDTRTARPLLKGLGLTLCVVVPIIVVTATSGADPESAGGRAGALARCVPSASKLTPYILCVQTLSPDSTGLDNARNYLAIKARASH